MTLTPEVAGVWGQGQSQGQGQCQDCLNVLAFGSSVTVGPVNVSVLEVKSREPIFGGPGHSLVRWHTPGGVPEVPSPSLSRFSGSFSPAACAQFGWGPEGEIFSSPCSVHHSS